MRFLDAYILARTKRKTRRIRMALVTIVSALLFAALIFGSFIAAGLQQSAAQFKDVGYNGSYLTQVYPNGSFGYDYFALEKEVKAQMDTELRARKIKVDDTVRSSVDYTVEYSKRINEVIRTRDAERQAATEKQIGDTFQPKAIYHLKMLEVLQSMQLRTPENSDPYLTQERKVVEGMAQAQSEKGVFFGADSPLFFQAEQAMLTPLLEQGQTLSWKPGDPYPALVPYTYVAKIANRSFVKLSSQEKIDAYAQLMQDYMGQELRYCYRNSVAQEQVSGLLRYNKQVETDKNAATKPVGIPECQNIDQGLLKKVGLITAPDPTVKPLFPQPPQAAPVTGEIRLKIVGFVPTMEILPSGDVFSSLFSGVNTWPGQQPILLPADIVAQDVFLQAKSNLELTGMTNLFVDFATRAEQKKFIDSGCSGQDCTSADKLFVTPFGSIKVALEGTFQGIMVFVKWVVLGVAIIAALMILMTISKVIADSRREIAVFRALGARRRDIAQIYFTYGMMLASSSLLAAIILAVVGALVLSARLSADANAVMVQAVGAYTMQTNTALFGVNWIWLLAIAAVLLIASFVGIGIPVLLSNRKNLVNVMRDE